MRKVIATQHFFEFPDLNSEIDGIYFVSNRQHETTIVIRTPRCWTTMVVFVFALQMAAFSSRTFLIQLDTDFQTPENPCRNSEKCAIRTPLSKKQIV